MNAGRVAGGAIAALVVAGIAWFAGHRDASPVQVGGVPSSAPMSAARTMRNGALADSAPKSAKAVVTLATLAEDPVCIARPPVAPRGDAASAADDDAASSAGPTPSDPLAPARARLLARLAASTDPYANAVAVWLGHDGDDASRTLDQRAAHLATAAASTRDPRLYGLALRLCWTHLE